MDLRIGNSGAQLNGAILQIGDCFAIIVCIPVFDSHVYPFVERCKGSAFTPHQKVGGEGLFGILIISLFSLDLLRLCTLCSGNGLRISARDLEKGRTPARQCGGL